MKKVMSILLILMLVLSLGITAFAEEPVDTSSVSITKKYTIDGTGTTPEETFNFTLAKFSVTDAAEGITTENMPCPATTAYSVHFNSLSASSSADFTVDLPTYNSVGIYTYKITETAGSTAGVKYNSDDLFLKVTVIDYNGSLLRIPAVHKGTEDGTKTKEIENTYDPGTLTIKKTVTGKLGDKSKYFKFTVTLTGENDKTYTPTLFTVTGGSSASNPKTGNLQMGENVFYLKHNETVTIGNLPAGITYTVVEDTPADYTLTKTGDTGTITKDGATAEFTNDKDTIVDTGVTLDSVPFIALFALAAVGMFVLLTKKRFN